MELFDFSLLKILRKAREKKTEMEKNSYQLIADINN